MIVYSLVNKKQVFICPIIHMFCEMAIIYHVKRKEIKMRIISLVLVIFLISLFSGCVASQKQTATYPNGKIFKSTANFRDMDLPLPEGEWKVIASGFPTSANNNMVQLILLKTKGEKIHSVVHLTRDSMTNTYRGYYHHKTLERTNIHHVVKKNNYDLAAQDGWAVNHYRLAMDENATNVAKQSYKYFKENNLAFPGNFIKILHHFTGSVDKKKYLDYMLFLNPEADGFAPPKSAEWASSDWNPSKINSDSKKVAYIEKIKKEHAGFHETLKKAFGY